MADLALPFARPFAFPWKSSGSGRRRRHDAQLQPLPPRPALLRLAPKVMGWSLGSQDCRVLAQWQWGICSVGIRG